MTFGSLVIPLNVDGYFLYTLTTPHAATLERARGTLDSGGRATAAFRVPENAGLDLIGLIVQHAFGVGGVGAGLEAVSNPISVEIRP